MSKKTRTVYVVMLDLSDKPVVLKMRLRKTQGRYPWNDTGWVVMGKTPSYSTYRPGDFVQDEFVYDTPEEAIKQYKVWQRVKINEYLQLIEERMERLELAKGLKCQE